MLTDQQLEMLRKLSAGAVWHWFESETDDEVVRSLLDAGYLRNNETAGDGYLCASIAGEAILEQLRKAEAKDAEQKAEEEAKEAKRLKERAEDYAHAERRYRTQNKITIITAILSFLSGVLVEHFVGIVRYFFGLFH